MGGEAKIERLIRLHTQRLDAHNNNIKTLMKEFRVINDRITELEDLVRTTILKEE